MIRTALFAAAGVLFSAPLAAAGWDNVFQVCCNDCRGRTSYYTPPPPAPCPQPEVRRSYVQRSYYTPVTEYKRETYYTPVEEKVKSYYWEPVRSVKYTTYYDPCSGCPQEIATPSTSYRLRETCNSVTRWIERSRSVPVTSLKEVTMMQPVVTYYYPPVQSSSRYVPLTDYAPVVPKVDEFRANPSVTPERMNGDGTEQTIPKQMLPTDPGSFQRSMPNRTGTGGKATTTAARKPATVRGEVVLRDQQTPRPDAKIIFVNTLKQEVRESTRTNNFGEFDIKLAPGDWYIYLSTGDGKAVYHKKLTVEEFDNPTYRVVSR